jgi:hypothetical protein
MPLRAAATKEKHRTNRSLRKEVWPAGCESKTGRRLEAAWQPGRDRPTTEGPGVFVGSGAAAARKDNASERENVRFFLHYG